jgi:hypothetical protein
MTATFPQQTNGAINAKFQPSFDPQEIALKALPGKPVHSPYQGDQIMFTLTDGRRWFADLYVSQTIEQMRLQAGEVFRVQKTSIRDGSRAIQRVEITAVVPEVPAPKPVASASSSDSGSSMSRHYRNAIDVVADAVAYAREKGLVIAPTFEDVRCLAAVTAIAEQRRVA